MSDDALADYVRDCANRMALCDWAILVSTDPDAKHDDAADNASASIECTFGRRAAAIWVDAEYWRTASAEDRRQTLVHELLHAHFWQARETVIQAVTVAMSGVAARVTMAIFDLQQEYGVDAVADVIAPFMPLPPEVP